MLISKAKINLFSSLYSKKMRDKYQLFIVDGWKTIIELLGKYEIYALCASNEWLAKDGKNLKLSRDLIFECSKDQLRKISQMQSAPEVIAVFHLPHQKTKFNLESNELYLMLDTIQDPGNMGTILRSADWFGVNNIIASETCVDIFNPKCIQASMGSISRVNVMYSELSEILQKCENLPIYGTLLNGENIYSQPLSRNGIIIFGNEGKGISNDIKNYISHPLLIPPYNKNSHAESLNVAAAVAVTLSIFRNK